MKGSETIDTSLAFAATFLFLQAIERDIPCDFLADLVSDMDWSLEADGQPSDLTIWTKYQRSVAISLGVEDTPASISVLQAARVIPIFLRTDNRCLSSKSIAQIATKFSGELDEHASESSMMVRWLDAIHAAVELPAK